MTPPNHCDYGGSISSLSMSPIEPFVEAQQEPSGDDPLFTTNLYDEPLAACGSPAMSSGSWDADYRCSERGGGVHQICVRDIAGTAPGFSAGTGQTAWSDERAGDNHCVCLGAWSLYKAKEKKKRAGGDATKKPGVLKCDAIPKAALTDRYAQRFAEGWTRWNGLEMSDQIKDGVEGLFVQCYDESDPRRSSNLRRNYCGFARNHAVLRDGALYSSQCN